MPWTASKDKLPEVVKDKSLELRSLFARVANAVLEETGNETKAIQAGIHSVITEENKKKKLAKAALEEQKRKKLEEESNYKPPAHLAALLEAQVLKKQVALDVAQNKETEFKEQLLKVFGEDFRSFAISQMYFDRDGKLVIKFDDGSVVRTTNAVPEEVINKYVNVSYQPQIKYLEPVTVYNNGNPEVVFTSDGEIVMTEVLIE